MKNSEQWISSLAFFSFLIIALLIFGCNADSGSDDLSSRDHQEPQPFPDCDGCHIFPLGAVRQILNPGGDFDKTSHHISGCSNPQFFTQADCENNNETWTSQPASEQCLVCHDISTHGEGIVRVRDADSDSSIAYDPSDPSGLEPFCLSCHDSDGAATTFVAGGTPFDPFGTGNGSILGNPPYTYSPSIAESWAKSKGHGPNGHHAPGDILTCLGSGEPGTGCHGNNGRINAHGSDNQVLAAGAFKYDMPNAYDEAYFYLCFNCHSFYPGITKEDIFGVLEKGILDKPYGPPSHGSPPPYYTSGVTTRFADHNEINGKFNDFHSFLKDINLHWFHIGERVSFFRGIDTIITGIVCVNCHDVHGSNTEFGAVYDWLGYRHFDDGVNIIGLMSNKANLDINYLKHNPTYCSTTNCHATSIGSSRAWFKPIDEDP